jgi:hypothetical protein
MSKANAIEMLTENGDCSHTGSWTHRMASAAIQELEEEEKGNATGANA